MPLEPIEESDLDLKSKFIEGGGVAAGAAIPEAKKEEILQPEKEPEKEIISAEKDNAYNKILSKVKSQGGVVANDEDVKNDATIAIEKQDAQSQIQHLVDIASTKGVLHAVKVAQHLEDNYVLDMFHDKLLSDEPHDALLQKGLIEDL